MWSRHDLKALSCLFLQIQSVTIWQSNESACKGIPRVLDKTWALNSPFSNSFLPLKSLLFFLKFLTSLGHGTMVWKSLALRALVFSERKTMGWGVGCGRMREWWQEGQEGIEKKMKVKRREKELRLQLQDVSPKVTEKGTARVGGAMDIKENIIFNAFKDQLKAHKTNLKT